MAKLTEQINIKLTAEDVAAIHAIAEREERSLSNTARRLLRAAMAITQEGDSP